MIDKKEEIKQPEKFVNPFNGKECDESITEKEAKERGYEDLQFILRYLEDDNEYFQWFKIEGKNILVKRSRPTFNYKKPTQINHERLFNEGVETEEKKKQTPVVPDLVPTNTCSIDSQDDCLVCGS